LQGRRSPRVHVVLFLVGSGDGWRAMLDLSRQE
jgi:hypothetical protein